MDTLVDMMATDLTSDPYDGRVHLNHGDVGTTSLFTFEVPVKNKKSQPIEERKPTVKQKNG